MYKSRITTKPKTGRAVLIGGVLGTVHHFSVAVISMNNHELKE